MIVSKEGTSTPALKQEEVWSKEEYEESR